MALEVIASDMLNDEEMLHFRNFPEGVSPPSKQELEIFKLQRNFSKNIKDPKLEVLGKVIKESKFNILASDSSGDISLAMEKWSPTNGKCLRVSQLAARFYFYEWLSILDGPKTYDEDTLTAVIDSGMLEVFDNNTESASKESIALWGAAKQYQLVKDYVLTIERFMEIAIGGELRHHSFVAEHILGVDVEVTSCNEEFEYDSEECICAICLGYEPEHTTVGYISRSTSWFSWLVWSVNQGPNLHYMSEELFLEFEDNGYGGKTWAQIAKVLAEYQNKILGNTEYQNEKLFIDRTFSLEHNNGCVFNKLYNTYGVSGVLNCHHTSSIYSLYQHTLKNSHDEPFLTSLPIRRLT